MSTAQLISAARSSGIRSDTATTPDSGTTAYSAKEDTARKWWTGFPPRLSRPVPSSRVPALIAPLATVQ